MYVYTTLIYIKQYFYSKINYIQECIQYKHECVEKISNIVLGW